MAETHPFFPPFIFGGGRESRREGTVAFVTNYGKGCTLYPWGGGRGGGIQSKDGEKSDRVGRREKGRKEGKKEGYKKKQKVKLAASCRGIGGETEMDTLLQAKTQEVGGSLAWPFSQPSRAAHH